MTSENDMEAIMPRFIEMMAAFVEHGGLVEFDGMPSEVRYTVVRGIEQFPRAGFAKMGRHFLDGKEIHPNTVIHAAQRLLGEGEEWEGDRDEWNAALIYVSRLDSLRQAMIALKEAAAEFDFQADGLGLRPADRNALFGMAIKKSVA